MVKRMVKMKQLITKLDEKVKENLMVLEVFNRVF